MTEPFLIAHLVRGEPAFDIASRMSCPECNALGCPECDEEGFWWVVPTSGHRAYPYWNCSIDELMLGDTSDGFYSMTSYVPIAPSPWPDHYVTRAAPSTSKSNGSSLLSALGLALRPSSAPIRRRV